MAVRGYHKDCSMAKVSFAAIDSGGVSDQQTWQGCETQCASNAVCEIWSYNTVSQQCTLSYADSAPSYTADSTAHFKTSCGVCPPPAIAPTAGWPGRRAEDSTVAFGGHQPMNLQCWPKNHNAALMRCDVATLQDVNGPAEWLDGSSWPGLCHGLSEADPPRTDPV